MTTIVVQTEPLDHASAAQIAGGVGVTKNINPPDLIAALNDAGATNALQNAIGFAANKSGTVSVPDATDAVKGKVQLATNAEALAGTDTTKAVTAAGMSSAISAASTAGATPDSTTSVKGKAALATQSEVNAGTDASKIVTSATLQAKLNALPAGAATSVPAAGITAGAIGAGVTFPATQLTGTISPANLPNAWDNYDAYANAAAFPAVGDSQVIYLAEDTNHFWRWNASGSNYLDVTAAGVTGSLPATAITAGALTAGVTTTPASVVGFDAAAVAAIDALPLGAAAVAGTTKVLGDDGEFHTLPAASALTFATQPEVNAGTVTNKPVAPDTLKAGYLSKTDTAAQTMVGDLVFSASKAPFWGGGTRWDGEANSFSALPQISGNYWVGNGGLGVSDSPDPTATTAGWHVIRSATGFGFGLEIATYAGSNKAYFRNGAWGGAWQTLGGASLGVNQTRQDVTASRAAGVPYPNNTGAPIFLEIATLSNGTNETAHIVVGGVDGPASNSRSSTASQDVIYAVVPDGTNYQLTLSANRSIVKWVELRV